MYSNQSKSIWRLEPRCDEILMQGLLDGLSFSQITDKMNLEIAHPFNKNMLIGRAHRLGLSSNKPPKPNSKPKKPKPKLASAPKPRKIWNTTPEVACSYEPPIEQRKVLYDLGDHDCRWPLGDPQETGFMFCGGVAAEGYVYCENHCRASYWTIRPIRNEGRPKLSGIALRARL